MWQPENYAISLPAHLNPIVVRTSSLAFLLTGMAQHHEEANDVEIKQQTPERTTNGGASATDNRGIVEQGGTSEDVNHSVPVQKDAGA